MLKKLEKIVAVMMSVMVLVCLIPGVKAEAVTQSSVSGQLNSLIHQYANTTATSSQMYMGSQCKGFANWVFKKLFGVYIGPYPESANYKIINAGAQLIGMIEPGGLTESTSRELLQKAKPGDYIQVQRSTAKSGGKCGPHSMIVVDVKSDGVQVFDCNSDGRNTIKNYLYTWSKFDYDNRAMSLYHAYDYQVSDVIADSELPVIGNVWITDKNKDGYTVNCIVTDNVAVDRVQFPTWTEKNGQDDLQNDWVTSSKCSGTKSGDTYTYRVSISDHNNEDGLYNTHIYAYDTSGNRNSYGVQIIVDGTKPTIKDVKIKNVTNKGYTVTCTVTDNVKVDRVQFPTWTKKQGINENGKLHEQDDIQKNWQTSGAASGRKSGNTYTYDVRISDHNNELGVYKTHIYAYDESGNWASYGIEVQLKVIYYGDVDKSGQINATDLSTINQAASGRIKLTAEEKKRADVNEDGKITKKDVDLVQKYIAEEIKSFPAELYHGDINKDGEIDIVDLGVMTRAIKGLTKLSAEQSRRADVNGDGKITTSDADLLKQYIVGKIDKFPAVFYGDVNMDGKINISDVGKITRAAKGIDSLSEEEKKRADVNGDAKITSEDSQLVTEYIAGKITVFPIGQ